MPYKDLNQTGERWQASSNAFHAIGESESFHYLECDLEGPALENCLVEKFYVIYCSEGSANLCINSEDSEKLSRYQSILIYAKPGDCLNIWKIEEESVKLCIIKCCHPKSNASSKTFFNRFKEKYLDKAWETTNLCDQNAPKIKENIASLWRLLEGKQGSGFVIEGITLQLFGLMLEQFGRGGEHMEDLTVLPSEDIQKLTHLRNLIQTRPEQNYNLEYLSSEYGISLLNLKNGFKAMSGYGINAFVTKVRLEKARELLLTTDMSIADIVYSIGETNRDYFTAIFKEKYHYSPLCFKKRHRLGND